MFGQGFLAGLLQGQAGVPAGRLHDEVLQDLRRGQQHAMGGERRQPGIEFRLATTAGAGELRGRAVMAGKQRTGLVQQTLDFRGGVQARAAQLRSHQPGLFQRGLRRRAMGDVARQRLALQRQEGGGKHRVLEFGHAWNRKGTLRRAQGGDARLPARRRQIAAAVHSSCDSGSAWKPFTVRSTKLELASATPPALSSLSSRKREKCSRSRT